MSHKLLWYKILKYGLSGNILTVLRNMYTQFKSCVSTPVGLTDYFSCGVGTRQGCVLSPFLFVLYINELMENMKNMGCQGIYIDENAPNIMMLYFADDIVDGADTVGRLQYMINVLENYCHKWGMYVNLTKTKIMVFRRGGILKKYEKWFFKGQQLEVVSFYKYLGLIFTPKLKWTLSKKTIALQAEKALNLLYMYNSKCGSLSVNIMLDLFDKIVLAILLYGSQI